MDDIKEIEKVVDWKMLLLNYYKSLFLTENDVIVLLMCDLCLTINTHFVSPDMLALKMSMDSKEIENVYLGLQSRGYIQNKTIDGKFTTSLEEIKNTLYSQFFLAHQKKNESVSNDNSILGLIEKEFGRLLTPFEIDTIREWVESGFSEELIRSAIKEAKKNGARSLRAIDRVLLEYKKQEEYRKEGNTTLSEKWRKDISETMNIAKTRWSKDYE